MSITIIDLTMDTPPPLTPGIEHPATIDLTASTPMSVTRSKKDCEICYENKAINTFPLCPHANAGSHARLACIKCWKAHINAAIKDGNLDNAKCLYCEHTLTPSEIRKLLTKPDFNKWLDQAAKTCMERSEEFIACPSATCSWGCYMDKDSNGNIFTCKLCAMRYCTECKVPMHEGMTCEEHAARKAQLELENDASIITVKATTKQCPKCHARIEKNHGCDHMRCTKCKHEFCWECFANYKGSRGIAVVGNNMHEPKCKYHTNRLPQLQ
ncbi:hypothetical protein AMS68_005080 [Peltaster fructicola]|uniref:RBR-type E3 ubiquitin transferase n=1 Tax=Peltaster fructicola TaxID=286661 RepID=A0A6H0XXT5_9PEZI|nr:hypothetical protein AMS68_005080 [Peltaster fructicola]